ncbi:MAG: pyridoxal-phosphate dependent enzyme, partial [Cytophagaceae bacterium]
MITFDTIQEAHDRIRPYTHRTAVLTNQTINDWAGAELFFKCENFQKIGAFKARGGLNAVLQVAQNKEGSAITTHSSGNHAQAVAFAARQVGMPAYIVMPRTAPQVKKDAVLGYGAEVIECEPTLDAREAGVREVVARTGAVLVHPFDDDRVIAGQATAAKELIEDAAQDRPFDVILAPVGGGGLL